MLVHCRSRLVTTLSLGALALVAVIPSPVSADDSRRSPALRPGDAVGVFYVTKIGGAEHDGVEVGQDLCYRCRYGSRPMVLVFIRNTNGKIPDYVRHLDSQVRKHESDRLKGLVVLYGGDGHRLKQEGEKLALSASIENIPITVAKDVMTGPLNYRLSSDVDMTVVVAEDSQVVRVFEFDADLIDTKKIDHTLQTLFDSLSDAAQ